MHTRKGIAIFEFPELYERLSNAAGEEKAGKREKTRKNFQALVLSPLLFRSEPLLMVESALEPAL